MTDEYDEMRMAREYIVRFTSDDRGCDVGLFLEKIVRCKDCKNFRRWIDTDITFCDLTEDRVCKDDFCSKAKRRTDG